MTTTPSALTQFMKDRGIRVVDMARATGRTRQFIHRVRGGHDLTQRSIREIVKALRSISGEDVLASELFDLGDGGCALLAIGPGDVTPNDEVARSLAAALLALESCLGACRAATNIDGGGASWAPVVEHLTNRVACLLERARK